MSIAEAGEFGLIGRIVPRLGTGETTLIGPGDDAAVVRAPDGRVVASTDVLVEGRHFRRDWCGAADVRADLPGAADEVPTRNRELFAWTIREAVTNIVRHSRARHVTVLLRPDSVEIIDDGQGAGPTPDSGSGSGSGQGLAGLRRRADQVGARLTAGSRPGEQGFRVRMEASS